MKIVLVLILAAFAFAAVSVAFDKHRMKQSTKALGLDGPGVRVIECPGPMFRFAVKPEEGIAWVLCGVKVSPVRSRVLSRGRYFSIRSCSICS